MVFLKIIKINRRWIFYNGDRNKYKDERPRKYGKEILHKRVAVADAYIAIWAFRLPYMFCCKE